MKSVLPPFPDDIIAAGPWIGEPGCFDRRIVLRDLGTQYVVHTQGRDSDGEFAFNRGQYFPKTNAPNNALSEAFGCFVYRTGSLLDTDAADVIKRMKDGVIVAEMRRRGLVTGREA